MKKAIGIILMMAMMVMVLSAVAEENIIHGWASDIEDMVGSWTISHGFEKYFKQNTDTNGYFKGYGVLDVNAFEKEYNIEWNFENMEKVIQDQYTDLEFSVYEIGVLNGYSIYLMEAKASDAIGWKYDWKNEEEIPYYEGGFVFMPFRWPED